METKKIGHDIKLYKGVCSECGSEMEAIKSDLRSIVKLISFSKTETTLKGTCSICKYENVIFEEIDKRKQIN